MIGTRYERRSPLVTANQPFGEWNKVFPDQAMTLAAVDRLVHHATILEMNVESYRRREAIENLEGWLYRELTGLAQSAIPLLCQCPMVSF